LVSLSSFNRVLVFVSHSKFDVERSMFDVQIVASEITTKPSYHVEIIYTGHEFWIGAKPLNSVVLYGCVRLNVKKIIVFFKNDRAM
jgi:hypothetical protein